MGASQLESDVINRFWSKVDRSDPDSCWNWVAGKNLDGYGRFRWLKVKKQAHHVAYYLQHREWPTYLLHECDNPACCNPAHLKQGTHLENVRDRDSKGRGRAFKNTAVAPQVKQMIAQGMRNRDICKALGVKNDAVSRIRNGHIHRSGA